MTIRSVDDLQPTWWVKAWAWLTLRIWPTVWALRVLGRLPTRNTLGPGELDLGDRVRLVRAERGESAFRVDGLTIDFEHGHRIILADDRKPTW